MPLLRRKPARPDPATNTAPTRASHMAATMQGIAGGAKARRDQASLAVLRLIVLTSTVNLKRGRARAACGHGSVVRTDFAPFHFLIIGRLGRNFTKGDLMVALLQLGSI